MKRTLIIFIILTLTSCGTEKGDIPLTVTAGATASQTPVGDLVSFDSLNHLASIQWNTVPTLSLPGDFSIQLYEKNSNGDWLRVIRSGLLAVEIRMACCGTKVNHTLTESNGNYHVNQFTLWTGDWRILVHWEEAGQKYRAEKIIHVE